MIGGRVGRQWASLVCVLSLVLLTLGTRSFAQEEPAAEAPAADAAPAEPEAAPAEQPAVAQDVKAAEEEAASVPEQSNFLSYCWKASPTFFILMTLISILMVYLAVNAILRLQLPRLMPPRLLSALDNLIAEKKFKEAYELVKSDSSPMAKVLGSGLDRLSQGYDRSIEAMYGSADESRMELEHSIGPINIISAVAPMIGLLGTVLGMILAFQKIGLGTQIKPALLAQDIGLALVSTLEGLIVAIPAIVLFAFLRNRVARLMYDIETTSEGYLSRFSNALKKSS